MKDNTIRFDKMYRTVTRNFLLNNFFLCSRVWRRSNTNQNNRNKIPCSLQNMEMKVMLESVRNLVAVASHSRQMMEERRKKVE